MKEITYKEIKLSEVHKIEEIDASTYIEYAWRGSNEEKKRIYLDYYEPGFPEHISVHKEALETTIKQRDML